MERRHDIDARQALERVQSQYLQQSGEVSTDVCTQPRRLYECLLQEILTIATANYGCVMRLTGGDLAESPFLELVSVVQRDSAGRLARQYDTLLNRRPEGLVEMVFSTGSPTWANNKRSRVPACLPDCRPPLHNFVIFPIVTRRKAPSVLFVANCDKTINEQLVTRIESLLSGFVRIHRNTSTSTQAQVAVQRYRRGDRHYDRLLKANFNGVMTVDHDGVVTAINPACERYFDVICSMAIGKNANNYIPGKIIQPLLDQACKLSVDENLSEIGTKEPKESIGIRSDGSEFPIQVTAFFSRIEQHVCVTLIIDDISDRIESARESEQAFFQLKTLTNLAPVGILQLSVDWTCSYANDMWYAMSELTSEESNAEGWIDAIHADDVDSTLNDLRESVCHNTVFKRELRLQKPLGGVTWVSMSATSTVDDHHRLTGFLVVFTDITEKHNAAVRLKQLAHHDTLTGLLNRLHFLDTLNEMIADTSHNDTIGLMSIDLDGFKAVNDNLGHDAGDAVLKEVADRLTETIGQAGMVARLGGDEFTVGLHHVESDMQTRELAIRIIENIQRPLVVTDSQVEISASVGIAIGEKTQLSSEVLIKQADVALYRAKQNGKSCAVIFSEDLNREQLWLAELHVKVRSALLNQQFELVYQPQIDLVNHEIMGFEALLRLPNEFGLETLPADVVKVLEDSGMIHEVGAWALRRACKDHVQLQQAGLLSDGCTVSVNVSARQLSHSAFLTDIDKALADTGIDPSTVILEITESALVEHSEKNLHTIAQIKKRGLKISLDDFGTGFSSLSYLSRLPIDHLKIDKSFIIDVLNCNQRQAIVRAIISMARALDICVVAEGVENDDVVQFLNKEYCHSYQGFHLSKAMQSAQIRTFLQKMTKLRLCRYTSFYNLGEPQLACAG